MSEKAPVGTYYVLYSKEEYEDGGIGGGSSTSVGVYVILVWGNFLPYNPTTGLQREEER